MAIKLIRTKAGEDIVADLDEKDDVYTLDSPAMLIPMSDGRGNQVQMGFGPWCPFSADKEIDIPKDWAVFVIEPAEDLKNNYRQAFGSGVVVPDVKVDTKTLLSG